jgi:Alpha-amylase/alpha-mannosidase
MERYICIHGHFYQPPRENPWLEEIEVQDSAYPFHDWNERITAECYATNGVSRILDGQNRIIQIVNNYARISFNFGPTLLSWMEQKAPSAYRAILAADRESQKYFSGHGSALAQVYNHIIMPLANRHDKYTQIFWGIRDFEKRFGRKPEGMWLAETAVDLETLDIMAELGIQFTILSPYQARRVRTQGSKQWQDVVGGHIDPTMAYLQHLPSGRTITLFFYDGPISQGVAFERLLSSGERFAHRLIGAFSDDRHWPQLVHIATDGETYGHHHRFGEMALAYALHYIESNNLARITIYGEYLERHPPTYEVEILENTSWSCFHGIERWRSNCGCNSGNNPGWNQEWRAPLRNALDWLRDAITPAYDEIGRQLLRDPWAARNDYIAVILDRSSENIARFLEHHAIRKLHDAEKVTVLKLMELQRHAMLMYTSCGWFFDELSGIETVQIIQYAGRVIQLAEELFEQAIEAPFLIG